MDIFIHTRQKVCSTDSLVMFNIHSSSSYMRATWVLWSSVFHSSRSNFSTHVSVGSFCTFIYACFTHLLCGSYSSVTSLVIMWVRPTHQWALDSFEQLLSDVYFRLHRLTLKWTPWKQPTQSIYSHTHIYCWSFRTFLNTFHVRSIVWVWVALPCLLYYCGRRGYNWSIKADETFLINKSIDLTSKLDCFTRYLDWFILLRHWSQTPQLMDKNEETEKSCANVLFSSSPHASNNMWQAWSDLPLASPWSIL